MTIDAQMNHGKTTVIEILTKQELGDPTRSGAMSCPSRCVFWKSIGITFDTVNLLRV
jgi:hypothetical protein